VRVHLLLPMQTLICWAGRGRVWWYVKVKKTNVDFWANVHGKCKRNSNFPH
jgi:hypothetical protein